MGESTAQILRCAVFCVTIPYNFRSLRQLFNSEGAKTRVRLFHITDPEELEIKLKEYKGEHKSLDEMINKIINSGEAINLFQVQALKKKKLWLKDMIQKIQSSLIDDIIA